MGAKIRPKYPAYIIDWLTVFSCLRLRKMKTAVCGRFTSVEYQNESKFIRNWKKIDMNSISRKILIPEVRKMCH